MVILKILIFKFGNEEKILKEIHSFEEKIKFISKNSKYQIIKIKQKEKQL
jgi:hypothetical protein